jgi:RNA polymerase I-specific transcription initiation factor RRN5
MSTSSSSSPSSSSGEATHPSPKRLRGSSQSDDEFGGLSRRSRFSSASYVDSEKDNHGHLTHERSGNRRLAKHEKRMAEGPLELRSKAKILKQHYNEDYRELFNASLSEFKNDMGVGNPAYATKAPSEGFHGSVRWASQEKELFFDALTRLGKGDVRGIAGHIGTKSEIEVDEYIQILHQALIKAHLHGYRRIQQKLPSLAELPASHEISVDCDRVLERAAYALMLHQEEYEYNAEKELHGDYWLINKSVAEWAQDRFIKGLEGVDEVAKVLPAATLLNPREWLCLSENVFMNPGPPNSESNWHNISFDDDEAPSLTHTAFSDFHSLTISVTRRLVQTALFCAESRLKATSNKHHSRDRNVMNRDITAALEMLKMKRSKFDFWVHAARRNNVEVEERKRKETLKGRAMSYDEVESILMEPIKRTRRKKEEDETPMDTESNTPVPASDGPSGPGGSLRSRRVELPSIALFQIQRSASDPTPSPPPSPITSYAQLQDQRSSRLEETYLWTNVLRLAIPPHVDLSSSLPDFIGKAPNNHKTRDELEHMSWRDNVRKVGSEWEAMRDLIPKEEFEEMGLTAVQNFEKRRQEDLGVDNYDSAMDGADSDEERERESWLDRSDEESQMEETDIDVDSDPGEESVEAGSPHSNDEGDRNESTSNDDDLMGIRRLLPKRVCR